MGVSYLSTLLPDRHTALIGEISAHPDLRDAPISDLGPRTSALLVHLLAVAVVSIRIRMLAFCSWSRQCSTLVAPFCYKLWELGVRVMATRRVISCGEISRETRLYFDPSWAEALRSPEREYWIAGARDELRSLANLQVFVLIPRSHVPSGRRPLKGTCCNILVCYLMPSNAEQRFLEIVSWSVWSVMGSMCSWAWAIQTLQACVATT
jgi:hypothetical protein